MSRNLREGETLWSRFFVRLHVDFKEEREFFKVGIVFLSYKSKVILLLSFI